MFKQKFYLIIFGIWQLFSCLAVAIGIWPMWAAYLNLVIQLLVIVLFDLEYALYSVIITIPFYLAVPNSKFDSLSAWRFTFGLIFLKYAWQKKILITRPLFFAWDRILKYLSIIVLLGVLFETFKTQGIKKFLFVLNVYLLYIVIINVIKNKEQLLRLIKATFISIASIVLLGYIQFLITLKVNTYYFWQYWATIISRAYYGITLSDSLTYSNSWFTFYKSMPPSLRMFSILPDSHAFALVAIFSVPLAATLLFFTTTRFYKIMLWVYIGLAALAIELSGTRGAYISIIAPAVVLIYLYIRFYGRQLLRPMFVPIILFVVFLILSPFAQQLAGKILHGYNSGNFLIRAESIYDLQESSNQGRLQIWTSSLKYAAKHPILGTGFGDFIVTLNQNATAVNPNFNALANKNQPGFNLPERYITAHSLYLDVLVETGIIGFILFVLYFGSILYRSGKFFFQKYLFNNNGYVFFVANFALYVIWLLAYSFFDGTLINDRVLMYFFIELAIAGIIINISPETNA